MRSIAGIRKIRPGPFCSISRPRRNTTARTGNAANDFRPPDDGRSFGLAHWVGGAIVGVQGHPPEPGTVLLLHMTYDPNLAFEYLDGGSIQFRISEDALAKRDWTAATVTSDSG
jgi:hypothetical protein